MTLPEYFGKKPHIKHGGEVMYVCVDGFWRMVWGDVRQLSEKWDGIVRLLERKAWSEYLYYGPK